MSSAASERFEVLHHPSPKIAGHDCFRLWHVYIGHAIVANSRYGLDVAAPDKPSWDTLFGPQRYRDINGRRYSFVYLRPQTALDMETNAETLYAMMAGVHNGSVVLTDISDQYKHFLTNCVFGNYLRSPKRGSAETGIPDSGLSAMGSSQSVTCSHASAKARTLILDSIGNFNCSCFCGRRVAHQLADRVVASWISEAPDVQLRDRAPTPPAT